MTIRLQSPPPAARPMSTKRVRGGWAILAAAWLCIASCAGPPVAVEELARFPVSSLNGVLSATGISFDAGITSDGDGSMRVAAEGPTTVRLYEIDGPDIENARLIYRAKVRTEDVEGQAYLEMWCRFPGKGEFFSRALHQPLSGTVDWTSMETPFFLRAGENPDLVKLNLVVDGTGTVWIDDIVLLKGPLG